MSGVEGCEGHGSQVGWLVDSGELLGLVLVVSVVAWTGLGLV